MNNFNSIKILIIEDEQEVREEISDILKFEGYDVFPVSGGAEGVKAAVENPPDIVICDILMPGMDGFEVLEKIRKDKKLKKLHVIIISAKTDSWSIKNAMDRGAFDYLTKPINIQDVKNKVKSAMVENVLGDDE